MQARAKADNQREWNFFFLKPTSYVPLFFRLFQKHKDGTMLGPTALHDAHELTMTFPTRSISPPGAIDEDDIVKITSARHHDVEDPQEDEEDDCDDAHSPSSAPTEVPPIEPYDDDVLFHTNGTSCSRTASSQGLAVMFENLLHTMSGVRGSRVP